ncbi:MAG: 50S ribosomal protein L29 [Phycisphaerales bacterium JB059]|jgi:ribosomal protein L29
MGAKLETDKKSERLISSLKDEEIRVEVKRLRESMLTLRSQSVSEKVEDTSMFGKTRRDIARLLGEQTRRAKA